MTLVASDAAEENIANNKINWRLVVKEQVIPALHWFKEQGITPTLRTLFYRLVSLEVIPNTKNSYKRLSKVLVKERKEGNIRWDTIADEGRLVICNFDDRYESPQSFIQRGFDHIENAHSWYKVPRWYGQKHYVEVWIEKQALADTFESFLEDRDVRIVVNKGYTSWSFLYENTKRLEKIHREYPYKHFHILYFGDFDPSGEDMDRHMNEGLYHFGFGKNNMAGIKLEFERVAITQEQIQEFDLPPTPEDSETLEKLDNDSRIGGFIDKYGELFAVELDALLAIVPDEFRDLVQESVDQYFDEDMYEEMSNKHTPGEIRRLVHQRLEELCG